MTLHNLFDVFENNNLIQIVDRQYKVLGYGLTWALGLNRGYLMGKNVLSVGMGLNFSTDETYIRIVLDVSEEELFK